MDTTPIQNIIQRNLQATDQFLAEFLAHCGANDGKAVERHRRVLGKQVRTFTGSRRYHVWENSLEGWRVYVHDVGGVSFEVEGRFSPRGAMMAWHHYLRRFGWTA